jgi:DNA-binding transcriptional ArsR family regulator
VHLDAASLARVRLATSPAAETVIWLQRTATGTPHPVFGDPGPAARFALRDPDVALVADVLTTSPKYLPDLLTPKPRAGLGREVWRDQLDVIGGTGAEEVLDQLAHCSGVSDEVRTAAERGRFARRAARGLSLFWRHAVADAWPELNDRMQADLAIRARTILTYGIGGLLASLHRQVAWTGSELRVDKPWDVSVAYEGAELVLAPSILSWPNLLVQVCDPSEGMIFYPARAVGAEGAGSEEGAGLARLLGNTRATLLRDLDVARTTSDLSVRHQLSPATVSYHLRVLHGSGLVSRLRERRQVLYRRTEQGDALHG